MLSRPSPRMTWYLCSLPIVEQGSRSRCGVSGDPEPQQLSGWRRSAGKWRKPLVISGERARNLFNCIILVELYLPYIFWIMGLIGHNFYCMQLSLFTLWLLSFRFTCKRQMHTHKHRTFVQGLMHGKQWINASIHAESGLSPRAFGQQQEACLECGCWQTELRASATLTSSILTEPMGGGRG